MHTFTCTSLLAVVVLQYKAAESSWHTCAGSAGAAARAAATMLAVPGGAAGPPADMTYIRHYNATRVLPAVYEAACTYVEWMRQKILPSPCHTSAATLQKLQDLNEIRQPCLTHPLQHGAAPQEQRIASQTAQPLTVASAAPAHNGAHPRPSPRLQPTGGIVVCSCRLLATKHLTSNTANASGLFCAAVWQKQSPCEHCWSSLLHRYFCCRY